MAIKKNKKIEIINESIKALKNAASVVFVGFNKLTVATERALRSKLRDNEVSYKVVKKTLLKRAAKDLNFSGNFPEIDGQVALVYGNDLLVPAREVYGFQKSHKENIQILGGIFENRFLDKEGMMIIATIPPKEVLYAQFVNLINSPIQGLVVVLDQIAEKNNN